MLRRPAVAGSWYPDDPSVLGRQVDRSLAAAPVAVGPDDMVVGLLGPHAGIVYSGAVAAAAYAAVKGRAFDLVVLVGPSHYVGFDGVAVWPGGAFETPLGRIPVPEEEVARLVSASPIIVPRTDAHAREHSLEMHLPFLQRALPGTPLVPLVMGEQTRETILALAEALAAVYRGRRVLVAASTDLSHFFDAATAARLDGRVARLVAALDDEGLLAELERYPMYERGRFVMCGGGPAVSVMRAARLLGSDQARVLAQAHSGDVSGDSSQVVGYLAAAFGRFGPTPPGARGPAGPH
jgi:AmmeMemoRadiSam system protein B